jgi:hypothetical protein
VYEGGSCRENQDQGFYQRAVKGVGRDFDDASVTPVPARSFFQTIKTQQSSEGVDDGLFCFDILLPNYVLNDLSVLLPPPTIVKEEILSSHEIYSCKTVILPLMLPHNTTLLKPFLMEFGALEQRSTST